MSLLTFQIAKAEVQHLSNDQKESYSYCSFEMHWTGGDPIEPLHQIVFVNGTKEPNRFFYFRYDPHTVGEYIVLHNSAHIIFIL